MFEGVVLSKRQRVVLKWLLALLVLFTVTGFLILPVIAKSVITSKLSEGLRREVAIGKIRINPYMLSMRIEGLVVKERNGTAAFASFDELYLNIQAMSVFKRGLVLRELRVKNPYFNIIRKDDFSYNFSDIIKENSQASSSADSPPKFSVSNIQILNGSADFADGPKKTRHQIRDLTLKIPMISNLPYYVETFITPAFSAKVNQHTINLEGRTKPFSDSLQTEFDLNIAGFNIPNYLAYVPFRMNFRLTEGILDAQTKFVYTQYMKKPATMSLLGNIVLKNIHIADAAKSPMIIIPLLDISIAASELTTKNIHFSKIVFESPEVHLVRDGTGRVNLRAIAFDKTEEAAAEEEGKKKGQKQEIKALVEADEIRIRGGKVLFTDAPSTSIFRTVLVPVDLTIERFSTAKDKKSGFTLSAASESGEKAVLKGDFSVNPPASDGSVEVSNVLIGRYAPYYNNRIRFDIREGKVDLAAQYSITEGAEEPAIKIADLKTKLSILKLRRKNDREDFLSIPVVEVRSAEIDTVKKEVLLGELLSQKGFLSLKRFRDGSLNINNLLAEIENAGRPGKPTAGGQRNPWVFAIKKLNIGQFTLEADDFSPREAVGMKAENIKLSGLDISTAKNMKGRASVSFDLNRHGAVSAHGTVMIDPLSADLNINAQGLDVVPFQPYVAEKINMLLTSGRISSKGTLSYRAHGTGGPRITYKGEGSMVRFASIDKDNAADFLNWENLHLDKIDFGYNPFHLTINEIALSDFYSRLIINSDGSLNVQRIMVKEKDDLKSAKSAEPLQEKKTDDPKMIQKDRLVKIAQVTVQGGTINFTDNYIKPNYSANFLEVGGRISGLSSEENSLADVDLKGKLENYAPLDIRGKVNPLKEDLYVDLKADFRDMDLSPLTPYAGKYMGYTIEKGKLSLDLKYVIVRKRLDSENKVTLDQFTLGDRVESPDATKLPVKLAIALLKNRKGEIDLDIPVTGNLDDPEFSLGKIIIKILVNILVKAATSPFALLGAVFGGGEEMSYIEFDYGSSGIPQQSGAKLERLIRALHERPSLKLDIEGYADREKDREVLHSNIFDRKIKAQKLKDMIRNGFPPEPVDQVKIEPDEYGVYLKMAYREETFPKPRNFLGFAKDLPVPEMEKLIRTNIMVTDDDLRKLASGRALAVREAIVKSGQVEPARIFLVEPKTLEPEKKGKLRDSRVDFRLK